VDDLITLAELARQLAQGGATLDERIPRHLGSSYPWARPDDGMCRRGEATGS
jgi:hypothetical protein